MPDITPRRVWRDILLGKTDLAWYRKTVVELEYHLCIKSRLSMKDRNIIIRHSSSSKFFVEL
jgi:hypothetical protein